MGNWDVVCIWMKRRTDGERMTMFHWCPVCVFSIVDWSFDNRTDHNIYIFKCTKNDKLNLFVKICDDTKKLGVHPLSAMRHFFGQGQGFFSREWKLFENKCLWFTPFAKKKINFNTFRLREPIFISEFVQFFCVLLLLLLLLTMHPTTNDSYSFFFVENRH